MHKFTRSMCLDICDYTDTALCKIYDSAQDIQGQAVNVFVNTERNGFKELTFEIPSKCQGEDGEEDNYRLNFLVNDYRIRSRTVKPNNEGGFTYETDWFLISESKINHNNFSKNVEVTAGHISQLLKTRNLDLTFSDDEGNNVGTIQEIANTILEGTGWHIQDPYYHFLEDPKFATTENQEKVRSFTASEKTGAFKMMNDLCEKFDAKPIYHGEGQWRDDEGVLHTGRTVEIIPMNPFSEDVETGAIPEEVLLGEDVLALYYDKNIRSITRTLNSENMVTCLRAYGSYGDRNGICNLTEAEHWLLEFDGTVQAGTEYCFEYFGGKYFFTPDRRASNVCWSDLDFASRMYAYVSETTPVVLFKVYNEPRTTNYTTLTYTQSQVLNCIPFVMDFRYYQKIGLLTDEMIQDIANFQIKWPQLYYATQEAAAAMADTNSELVNNTSADTGYMKLKIRDNGASFNTDNNLVLALDTSDNEGVIYRSDYQESHKNYFGLRVVRRLKSNGLPATSTGAVVYIVRTSGNSATWTKAYVRALGNEYGDYYRDDSNNCFILSNSSKRPKPSGSGTAGILYYDDDDELYTWFNGRFVNIHASDYDFGLEEFPYPSRITLWTSKDAWRQGDHVFFFSSGAIAGVFGPREDAVESNAESVSNKTVTYGTRYHTLTIINTGESMPAINEDEYEWCYKIHPTNTFGTLYFRCEKYDDVGWNEVLVSFGSEDPENVTPDGIHKYYYSAQKKMLYIVPSGSTKWTAVDDTTNENKLVNNFAVVLAGCLQHERFIKGVYSVYTHNLANGEVIPIGDYAFRNEFGTYWLFTTTKIISKSVPGDKLVLHTLDDYNHGLVVYQDESQENVIFPAEKTYDVLDFPKSNELTGITMNSGYITAAGACEQYSDDTPSSQKTNYYSNKIYVHEETEYTQNMSTGNVVHFYSKGDSHLGMETITTGTAFTTPSSCTYIRITGSNGVKPTAAAYLRVKNYGSCVFVEDQEFKLLSYTASGAKDGLPELMRQFVTLSDDVYITKLGTLQSCQEQQTVELNNLKESLGDLFREGFWQEDNYVGDDQNKLYADSLDNLEQVAKPEATYDFSYLDLYGSDRNVGYSTNEESEEVEWPDIDIRYAAHLVDADIDTNCWAYIDSIHKCYDQPWKTEIKINTRLSMIGQQSFTDVMARIAEVAREVKAHQSVWKRGSVLSGSGKLAAERLEGAISANRVYLLGGASNWYTDAKGNIIFEAEDGNSAMMLTGRGFCVASSKDELGDWNWRTFGTGYGFTADEIIAGYLSAERIEAGSITTDKVSASFGEDLELSSNNAVVLCATRDGSRPAGSVYTPRVASTDSYIAIGAESSASNPAYINIMSGGVINIEGSTMYLKANGNLSVDGGSINMNSGSSFSVHSEKFNIDTDGNVTLDGTITANEGSIAGFTIGHNAAGTTRYIRTANMSISSTNVNGLYLGTNGINFTAGVGENSESTYVRINTSSGTSSIKMQASSLMLGNSSGTYSNATSYITGIASAEAASAAADVATARFECNAETIANSNYKVGDTWVNTGNSYLYTYICKSVSTPRNSTSDWVLTGTKINGAKLSIDAVNGTIDMVSANRITIAAGSTATISAGDAVAITTAGTVTIGNGSKLFTIGADVNGNAYIKNGKTSFTDSINNGIYLGTDGIRVGNSSGYFSASADGTVSVSGSINSTSGSIGTWTIGADYIGNASSRNASTIGLANLTGTNIALWAGGVYNGTATNAPKFSVTAGGYLTSTSGTVGGWTIGDSSLSTALTKDDKTYTVTLLKAGSTADPSSTKAISIVSDSVETFSVTYSGLTTASNVDAVGTYKNKESSPEVNFTSSGGTIAGWTIGSDKLYGTNYTTGMCKSITAGDVVFWGGNTSGLGDNIHLKTSNYYVTSDGFIRAVSGVFGGSTDNNKNLVINGGDTSSPSGSGTAKPSYGALYCGRSKLYKLANETLPAGAYFGADGISVGKENFYSIVADLNGKAQLAILRSDPQAIWIGSDNKKDLTQNGVYFEVTDLGFVLASHICLWDYHDNIWKIGTMNSGVVTWSDMPNSPDIWGPET